ncbi:hypothetical protein W911_12075 [Hyphomicrobium nitrativorans NL23]|uniref:Plasmid stabilization protein n=1 Tax=Hyphomicrobium nitrativorans NL23 TaxID=1029756 RepID=V5SJH6_9HYPH|nr:hypothetical protein [Hyphomicrobium nitrativorans]AHB50245.1 hypothetical protein W911_12075 [Hyphomicrobium nitrativorans NL23]
MRSIRVSRTFNDQLNALLAYGEERFGRAVAEEKKTLVYAIIRDHLAWFPASHIRDPELGLHFYPVTHTPFTLVYDFDEAELRIHFVLHQRADRGSLDPGDVAW